MHLPLLLPNLICSYLLCICQAQPTAWHTHTLNMGTSKDPAFIRLKCRRRFNLLLSAVHLPGTANSLADALSHNNPPPSFFCSNYPQANTHPSSSNRPTGALQNPTGLFNTILFSLHSQAVCFTALCPSYSLQPYPCLERTLCLFMAYLGKQHPQLCATGAQVSNSLTSYRPTLNHFLADTPKLHYVL